MKLGCSWCVWDLTANSGFDKRHPAAPCPTISHPIQALWRLCWSKLSGVFAGHSHVTHPQQYDLTWTGRGKRPRWVMAWLAEGGRMEELGVQ